MLFNGTQNRGLKLRYAVKNSSRDLLLGQVTEKALDHVEPGSTGGREVELDSGVACQPAQHDWVLVGAVVIGDQMNNFSHS